MNEVVFNSILIADTDVNTAKYVKFSNGINVITSIDNTVGKSCIIKSLYYSLGAEVEFDNDWQKENKLCILDFTVNQKKYSFARLKKNFAIFQNDDLKYITNDVTKELSIFLSEILNFSIFLPNKKTGKNELAPPVFTFLPYYIDQDLGWGSEPYLSFKRLDQYKSNKRKEALYYHLNLYNKEIIEIDAKINQLKDEVNNKKEKINELKKTISILEKKANYIFNASNENQVDTNIEISKERINFLLDKINKSRSNLQKFEVQLAQFTKQLNIITEYNKIKRKLFDKDLSNKSNNIIACPRCGYMMEDEIKEIVRQQYSIQNEKFVIQQIEILINNIKKQLQDEKNNYISLIQQLKNEEKIQKIENTFEQYIKYKGLNDTINGLLMELNELTNNINNIALHINALEKEKNKLSKRLSNRQEINKLFSKYLKENLIKLNAWSDKYENQLKILNPIKGQGNLSIKIILSHYVAFFMTMETIKSDTIRLPFVIDSPRGKEASKISSLDILKLILDLNLPQIILSTIEFDDFKEYFNENINIVELSNEKRKVLNNDDFLKFKDKIKDIKEIINNFSKLN